MIAAIDIGGTKIAAGIVDENGRVLASQECPTQPSRGPQDATRRMAEMLRATAREVSVQIEGVGIGSTGPVNPREGTFGNVEFLPGWEGFNLTRTLSEEFGVTAALENDADAAALGEWAWGAGQGSQSFILVTVGTGIGTGAIVNGELYRGVDGSHPEMGHHIIDPSGPACYYGGRGCWESLASGPAMERWARDNHPESLYRTAGQLCEAAEQGDPYAQVAVERTAGYLGVGLANLVMLFVPEVIALGGGLMESRHLFMPEIEKAVRTLCSAVPYEQVKIVPAAFGAQAGLVGAAEVWRYRYG